LIRINNSILNTPAGLWLWDFNDGNYDNSQSPTHVFISTATFDVKLIATNQYNCKDSISKQIEVLPSSVASFTVNDTVECFKNNRFVFTNTGNLYDPTGNWYWNFGDGITDTAKNQMHSYKNTGTFPVKLLSNNQYNCPDSSEVNLKVNPSPDATFTINNPIQCLTGNSFSFTKNDQLSVFNDVWNFGDAQTSSGKSAIHSYVAANIYNVRLIVTAADNCSDTTSQTVTVKPNPLAPTATNNSPLCEEETLNLFANTTETVSFDWTADNGFSSAVQNPVISNVSLSDSGFYYIKTIMNGCESSKVPTRVIIYPKPFFSFNQNQTICPGDMIILDPGFFNSYLWQDNSVKRIFNVTEPGLYKVVVFNTYGCDYSDSVMITKKCPTALFIPTSFSPNNDNINDRFEIVTDNIREFDLKIYNRWGELIFHSSDPANFWDGTYKNANCMDGVYYYQLMMWDMDGKTREMRGTVTVVR